MTVACAYQMDRRTLMPGQTMTSTCLYVLFPRTKFIPVHVVFLIVSDYSQLPVRSNVSSDEEIEDNDQHKDSVGLIFLFSQMHMC
jgi:hypothetical protein